MRKFLIKLICVTLATASGLASSANAQWPQTTAHNPWSLEIGAKAMERPGSRGNTPIITDSITLEPLFTDDDASDLGVAPAAEVKFNFETQTGQEYEIRSILANWDQSITPILGPNLSSGLFPTGATISQFEYEHDSDFFSIEIMGRRAVHPGMVLMFGPRVVSTKDLVRSRTTALVDPGGGLPIVPVTAQTSTDATNILLGLQGGFEINRPITNGMYVSSFLRAGGYYNPTEVTDVSETPRTGSTVIDTVTTTRTKSTGSFLGEVGGRVYYDFIPNCLSGYVGYEANWIDGIALAPANVLAFPAPAIVPAVDTANTVFFHGVTFGLKCTY